MANGQTIKAADPRAGIPQERITGDILRGRGPRRGNLEQLLDYWRPIMRKPGGFRRCLVILADHPELYPLPPLCAWLHHETTGKWPNEGNRRRGGRRGGRSPSRRVRRAARRARKDLIPVDARAYMGTPESIMSSPIGYGNFGLVDYKASRLLRGAASALLPGERNMFRISPTRRIGYSLLAPGGRNNPLIGVGLPGRIGGGTRGYRCPPGFENGGRFTDARFSTCGSQLFATPGATTPIRETLRTVGRAVRQEAGSSGGGSGRASRPRRGAPNLTNPVRDTVNLPENAAVVPARGRTNAGRQNSVQGRIEKAMAKAKPEKINRLVRSDGQVLVPAASVATLAKQRDNDDIKDSVYISKVNKPVVFGGPELDLFRAGVKKISFVLPGGTTVEVVRNGSISRAEYDKIKKAAFARVANRPDIPDIDPARPLSQAVAASSKLTMNVKPAKNIPSPQRLVVVERGSARRTVPRWVYETFLSQNAPGRPKTVKPYTFVEVRGKELPDDVEDPFAWAESRFKHNFNLDDRLGKPWHFDEPTMWGPLDYTASPIPRDDRYWDSLGFKAASFDQAQYDSLHGIQVKKVVFDRAIGRFRCAQGTANGGQLTNRSGLGCGGGVVGAVRRAVGAVADRAGDALDVTARAARGPDTSPGDRRRGAPNAGRIRPRTPSQAPRRQRGAIRDRLADGLDVTGRPERQRERGRLRDRLADELDFTNVPRRERRRGRLRERLANLIDPEPVRRDKPRKQRNRGFGDEVLAMGMADFAPIALRDFRDTEERKWRDRIDGEFSFEEARRWLQANKDDISERRYEREVDDLLDLALANEAIEKDNLRDVAELVDNLEDRNLDRIIAGIRAERVERDRLSLERRQREQANRRKFQNLVANEDLGIPLSEAEKLNDQDRVELRRRLQRHERSVERIEGQIEGARDSNEVAVALGELVQQRDKYQAQADEAKARIDAIRNDSLQAGAVGRRPDQDPADLTATERRLYRQWAGAQTLADMYGEANERHRWRVVAAARVEKAADNGVGFVKLDDLRTRDLPEAQANVNAALVNEIPDIDDLDSLDARINALRTQQDAALEKIRNADQGLAEVVLTDDKVEELVRARADAGAEYEGARRGILALQGRRRELQPVPTGAYEGMGDDRRQENALGAFDAEGRPVFQKVERNKDIATPAQAIRFVERGGDLAEVPDDYLYDAIVNNIGDGKRFRQESGMGGINSGGHRIVTDRETGTKMSLKAGTWGAHEPVAEVMANQIMAQLGFPMNPMRMTRDSRGRGTVVFAHANAHWNVANIVDGQGGRSKNGYKKIKDPQTRVGLFINDFLTGHSDRHSGNYLYGRLADGSDRQVIIPIDNGLGFGLNPARNAMGEGIGGTPMARLVQSHRGSYPANQLEALQDDVQDGSMNIEEVLDAFEEAQGRLGAADDYLDWAQVITPNLPTGYKMEQKGDRREDRSGVARRPDVAYRFFDRQLPLFLDLTREELRDILLQGA